MRERIETLAHCATSISVLIALGLLIFNVHTYNVANAKDTLLKWQKEQIYGIISATKAATFDEIKSQYLASVQQEKNIPLDKKDIQDSALRSILYSLSLQRAILKKKDNSYIVANLAYEPIPPEAFKDAARDKYLQMATRHQTIVSNVINFLLSESGKYSSDDLLRKLRESYKDLDDAEYNHCMSYLMSTGQAYFNAKGNVCSGLRF